MASYMKMGLLVVAMSYTAAAFPQTVTDSAFANMQRAMGGIIQNATAARGYIPADPRTYATLRSVGTSTAAAAATAGAGLLIGGTAPAWGTILAVAAVSGAVSYGVSLGIDSAVKWAFGTSSTTPITVTTSGALTSQGVTTGQTCWAIQSSTYCASSPQEVVTQYVLNTTVFSDITTMTLTPETVGTAQYNAGRRYTASIQGHRSDLGGTTIYSNPSPFYVAIATASITCPPGFVAIGTSCASTKLSSYTPPGNTPSVVSLNDAINQLTAAQKQTAVSYDAMALMINQMWQKAAAQPGYDGVPYSVTNPVTAAQVQQWAEANPSSYPNVGQLTAPVSPVPSGFAPSTTQSTTTPVAPATNSTSSTATNASTQPVINLGADPNITFDPPTTPTADSIFQPFTDIAAPFVNFQFNAPAGVCPKPTFEVFGASLSMTQHCDIFEGLRSTIQTVMSAVFLVAAFVIVFTA